MISTVRLPEQPAEETGGSPAASAGTNGSARATLTIQGMDCASCVGQIEGALRSIAGVTQADVNLVTERATILFDAARVRPPI